MQRKITADLLAPEFVFTTSRSSGPGGQNVNKVNSRVTLEWNVVNSRVLTDEEKNFLIGKLASRMTREGIVQITSQESRSQIANKDLVVQKLDNLLAKAFAKKKVRKATKPSKSAKQQRLKKKKVVSEKKNWRKRPDIS
jgi:ribosome-associated protein